MLGAMKEINQTQEAVMFLVWCFVLVNEIRWYIHQFQVNIICFLVYWCCIIKQHQQHHQVSRPSLFSSIMILCSVYVCVCVRACLILYGSMYASAEAWAFSRTAAKMKLTERHSWGYRGGQERAAIWCQQMEWWREGGEEKLQIKTPHASSLF